MADEPELGQTRAAEEAAEIESPKKSPEQEKNESFGKRAAELLAKGAIAGLAEWARALGSEGLVPGAPGTITEVLEGAEAQRSYVPAPIRDNLEHVTHQFTKIQDIVVDLPVVQTNLPEVDRAINLSQKGIVRIIKQSHASLRDSIVGTQKEVLTIDRNIRRVNVDLQKFQRGTDDKIEALTKLVGKLRSSDAIPQAKKFELEKKSDATPAAAGGLGFDDLMKLWMAQNGLKWLKGLPVGAIAAAAIAGTGIGVIASQLYEHIRVKGLWEGLLTGSGWKSHLPIDDFDKAMHAVDDAIKMQADTINKRIDSFLESYAKTPPSEKWPWSMFNLGPGETGKASQKLEQWRKDNPGKTPPLQMLKDAMISAGIPTREEPRDGFDFLAGTDKGPGLIGHTELPERPPDTLFIERVDISLDATQKISLSALREIVLKAQSIVFEADEIEFKGKVKGLPGAEEAAQPVAKEATTSTGMQELDYNRAMGELEGRKGILGHIERVFGMKPGTLTGRKETPTEPAGPQYTPRQQEILKKFETEGKISAEEAAELPPEWKKQAGVLESVVPGTAAPTTEGAVPATVAPVVPTEVPVTSPTLEPVVPEAAPAALPEVPAPVVLPPTAPAAQIGAAAAAPPAAAAATRPGPVVEYKRGEGYKPPVSTTVTSTTGGGKSDWTRGGAPTGAMMGYAMDQLRKEGVPEENLRAAAAHLVGQAQMESGLRPSVSHDQGTGYGIYGARLDRRTRMLDWLSENNYAQDSAEGQMRYMAHEAMTDSTYSTTRNVLMNASEETFARDTPVVTGNFEAPRVINYRTGSVQSAYREGPSAPTEDGGVSKTEPTGKGDYRFDVPLTGGAAARGPEISLGGMNTELRARLAAAKSDINKAVEEGRLPESAKGFTIGSGMRPPDDPSIQRQYQEWLNKPYPKRPMADPRRSRHRLGEAADLSGLPTDRESVEVLREIFTNRGIQFPVRGEQLGQSGMPHAQLAPGGEQLAPTFLAQTETPETQVDLRRPEQEVAKVDWTEPTKVAEKAPTAPAPEPQTQPVAPEEKSTWEKIKEAVIGPAEAADKPPTSAPYTPAEAAKRDEQYIGPKQGWTKDLEGTWRPPAKKPDVTPVKTDVVKVSPDAGKLVKPKPAPEPITERTRKGAYPGSGAPTRPTQAERDVLKETNLEPPISVDKTPKRGEPGGGPAAPAEKSGPGPRKEHPSSPQSDMFRTKETPGYNKNSGKTSSSNHASSTGESYGGDRGPGGGGGGTSPDHCHFCDS